jgi:hypothetical protein
MARMTLAFARSPFSASARKATVAGNRMLVVGASDSGPAIRSIDHMRPMGETPE